MRDVAIWKYLHQIPVEDKATEKIILEDIRRRSEEKGLSERDISVVMAIFVYTIFLIQSILSFFNDHDSRANHVFCM